MYFSERKVPRRKTLKVNKNGITLFPDEKHVHKVLRENIQSVTFCGKKGNGPGQGPANGTSKPISLYLQTVDNKEYEFVLVRYGGSFNPYQLRNAIREFSGKEDIVKTECPLWFLGVNPFHSGYAKDR